LWFAQTIPANRDAGDLRERGAAHAAVVREEKCEAGRRSLIESGCYSVRESSNPTATREGPPPSENQCTPGARRLLQWSGCRTAARHRSGARISSCRRASARRFATERRTPAKKPAAG
jgi:hypothetical protein